MTTVGALRVHMGSVHKENLARVPNAKEGRDDVDTDVFGMEGVPEELLQPDAKRQRVHGVEEGTADDDDGGAAGAAGFGGMPMLGGPVPPYGMPPGMPGYQ